MTTSNKSPSTNRVARWLRAISKWILPMIVLLGATLGAKQMIDTAPVAPRRAATRQAKMVEVTRIAPTTQSITIDTAMGVVYPAQQVDLRPRVSGQVEWLDSRVEPGSHFVAGQSLLRIEAVDYQLAVDQKRIAITSAEADVAMAQAALVVAENDLVLESGNQKISEREYEMLGETVDPSSRDLMLRVPQLNAATAAVNSAQAALEAANASLESAEKSLAQAELDLQRTNLAAPFNAVIAQKSVSVGDVVTSSTELLTLYNTDVFWVELSIPASQLRWVRIGDPNTRVTLTNATAWGTGQYREGRVIRRLPEVDSNGRMARLLVRVDDPLSLQPANAGKPVLLVNDYLRASIEGVAIDNVIALPREWVHDGDTAWVMNDDDTLSIRSVNPIYRGRDHVLIASELYEADRIITTDITAPVEGMPLRLAARSSSNDMKETE